MNVGGFHYDWKQKYQRSRVLFIYLVSYLFIYLFFIKGYNMGTMAKNGFRKQYLLLPTQQVLEKNEIESTLRGSLWRYQ